MYPSQGPIEMQLQWFGDEIIEEEVHLRCNKY